MHKPLKVLCHYMSPRTIYEHLSAAYDSTLVVDINDQRLKNEPVPLDSEGLAKLVNDHTDKQMENSVHMSSAFFGISLWGLMFSVLGCVLSVVGIAVSIALT